MNSIETAKDFLDEQTSLAIWYAEYIGAEESIRYANSTFASIFNLSIDEILARQKYHLVNPPETTASTLQQYHAEDRQAMQTGDFVGATRIAEEKQLIVLKLKFDRGVLGMFKTVECETFQENLSLHNLDDDFQRVIERVAPFN